MDKIFVEENLSLFLIKYSTEQSSTRNAVKVTRGFCFSLRIIIIHLSRYRADLLVLY